MGPGGPLEQRFGIVGTAANFMPQRIANVYNKYVAGGLEARFKRNPVRLSTLRGRAQSLPPKGAAKEGLCRTMREAGLI